MIPSIWRNWTNCLVIAGAFLFLVGCGGSDIPDPEADSPVGASEAAPPAAPAPVAAAESEPKAEEAAPPAAETPAPTPDVAATPPAVQPKPEAAPKSQAPPNALAAATPPAAPDQPATPETAPTPTPPTATPDAQPKPDSGATTSEMLALSSGSSPAAPQPPAAPGAGQPGSSAATPAPSTSRGKEEFTPPTKPNEGAQPKNRMIARGGKDRDEFDGFGGKDRDGGRGPRSDKPADFNNPRSSVQAFLDALEDKDVDRLSEATALRSPFEASAKNRDLFQKIVDGSISEAQLNDLAEKLDEFTISGEGARTSTGKVQILVSKTTDTGRHQRTITVRKEKAGWKVLDISSIIDFKTFARPNANRNRSNR